MADELIALPWLSGICTALGQDLLALKKQQMIGQKLLFLQEREVPCTFDGFFMKSFDNPCSYKPCLQPFLFISGKVNVLPLKYL